jgi:Xaa-Pro aminopeptidase
VILAAAGGAREMDVNAIAAALREERLDAWLFYDFHVRDPVAYRVLGLEDIRSASRRWFYLLPARGEPVKIVSSVEKWKLDRLPGRAVVYRGWRELNQALAATLGGLRRVAMNVSPACQIPVISLVDSGTVELVRSFGCDVVSSVDLAQRFEATIDQRGYKGHLEAGRRIHRIKDEAFDGIRAALASGRSITEYDVQQSILAAFGREGLTCDDHPPMVGVNDHAADPHFECRKEGTREIRRGDAVLIDLWARLDEPASIYHDITWCGFAGTEPPAEYLRIFRLVCKARDAAVGFVRARLGRPEGCRGWEVDDHCRSVITDGGYGERFLHRTGHSIGTTVHGNGANLDNLETHDDRRLVPGLCFSVEPGIYLEGRMAARSEVNVFITPDGKAEVTGPAQQDLVLV